MIVETTRPRVVRVVRPVSPYCDCGDVKRRQVRSTESAEASEVQWTEQEYRVEPPCRSGRKTRFTR